VTLATFFAGFTKFSRAILYIICQFIGGIMGSAIIWGWITDEQRALYGAGNCNQGSLSDGRALLVESSSYFWFLFVVFGVAFDPAQRRIYGPVLAPFFLAAMLGSIVILSSIAAGYGGVWLNPTRCFGAAVISGRFSSEVWISIVSMLIASIGMAVYYIVLPFNHEFRSRKKQIKKSAGASPQQPQQQQHSVVQ
jgi:glycerol uptake facilitator-like aquaporin